MTGVLVGVGNEYRRDDGVGPAVARAIRRLHLPGVRVAIVEGDVSALLDTWEDADLVVIVDAVVCRPPQPGRIHRGAAPSTLGSAQPTSSHGLGITAALALAAALGREPRRAVVYAVEADDLGYGIGLSPAVSAALPVVIASVAAEIRVSAKTRRPDSH